jgi:RES domain-containing protein
VGEGNVAAAARRRLGCHPGRQDQPRRSDRWLKANTSALLVVPSVIVGEERNVLINPLHPDAGRIVAHKLRKWTYDPRLMRSRA